MRAESLTEVPVIGRLLTTPAAKRMAPPVPHEVQPDEERTAEPVAP